MAAAGRNVCLGAVPGPRATGSGFRGRRAAQKASTASVTAVLMSDCRSVEPDSSSSSRLMIEPPSSRTAGMIFVPSVGGLSHNVREYTKPEHLQAGASVLLHAALRLAE